MNKKNLFLKFGLMISVISFAWISFTSATSFQFQVDKVQGITDAITQNIIPIHFTDNWNDFWGFLYFANDGSLDETSEDIYMVKTNADAWYACERKIKWFYYNAERWEILRPLDPNTWNVNNLVTEGWIYTLCRWAGYTEALEGCNNYDNLGYEDRESCISAVGNEFSYDDAYYWAITHTTDRGAGNIENFKLIVGIKYNTVPNVTRITPSLSENNFQFAQTFMRIKNKIPVGFVYDYKWWVWFAWCEVTPSNRWHTTLIEILKKIQAENERDRKKLTDLFSLSDSILVYNGEYPESSSIECNNIGKAGDSLSRVLVEWIVWLNKESSLGIQWNQTSSKMQYFASANINNATIINYAKRKSEILCRWKWNETAGNIICLNNKTRSDAVDADGYKNKTLIVKGRNVKIKPYKDGDMDNHYDIFINGWNLIIDETDVTKKVFNTWWFYTTVGLSTFQEEIGAAIDSENGTFSYTGGLSSVGVFVKGNFIIDWKVESSDTENGLKNKYFIYWKFTSKDDTLTTLENTFKWRCNNWVSNDLFEGDEFYYCPPSAGTYSNPYANASLVVINQDYDSPLYK